MLNLEPLAAHHAQELLACEVCKRPLFERYINARLPDCDSESGVS